MKKVIVRLVCSQLAPLAFAQTSSTQKKQTTTTMKPVRVTGAVVKITSEEGSAATY